MQSARNYMEMKWGRRRAGTKKVTYFVFHRYQPEKRLGPADVNAPRWTRTPHQCFKIQLRVCVCEHHIYIISLNIHMYIFIYVYIFYLCIYIFCIILILFFCGGLLKMHLDQSHLSFAPHPYFVSVHWM